MANDAPNEVQQERQAASGPGRSHAEERDLGATGGNTQRPQDSLGRVPPAAFLPRPDAPVESTFEVST